MRSQRQLTVLGWVFDLDVARAGADAEGGAAAAYDRVDVVAD